LTDRALFGGRLRIARERRKLTLDHLADETKLSASMLAALEDGTCARWPVGVYSRSYVRSYAELVGLDPAETVDEFASLYPHLAFVDSGQDSRANLSATVPRRLPRAPVAPLRLFLEDIPAPWWSRLLSRLACWLQRMAGGRVTPLPEVTGTSDAWSPGSNEDASPFATLQVDHE
jgi:transcriptional regulator with XRE-family HTH domain